MQDVKQCSFFSYLFFRSKAQDVIKASIEEWILRADDDTILNANKNEFDFLVKLHKCKKWQDEEAYI